MPHATRSRRLALVAWFAAACALAGCASGADYEGASLTDPAKVLSASDAAQVTRCAQDFGARTGADRVVVALIDTDHADSDTERLARSMFAENSSDEQLILIENVTTRYVWVEMGGEIRRHIGAENIRALTVAHIEDFRAGPRQGICATLADAASHVSGWKRIPLAGWIAGIAVPVLAAGGFLLVLFRTYRLKTARHVYDIDLVRYEHVASEDAFIREYQTRVQHSNTSGRGPGGGGGGGGGMGRSSGGGTHF
jgi:uncharacterized membrane protein YgcG